MLHNKEWSTIFAPEGRLLRQGDTIRRTNYSRTLSIIANGGPGAFYKVQSLPFWTTATQLNTSNRVPLLIPSFVKSTKQEVSLHMRT